MMNKAPTTTPAPDLDQGPDEPRKSEVVTTRPKAAFQWPPDCVWPFIDQGRDTDT
jgi:hypothetical protein